jgi:hypothetical protein
MLVLWLAFDMLRKHANKNTIGFHYYYTCMYKVRIFLAIVIYIKHGSCSH